MQRVRLLIRAAKFLYTVRAALPKWMRGLLSVAIFCTCLPGVPDFGLDETIYTVVGLLLWFRYRPLLRVIWHAAELEESSGLPTAIRGRQSRA